MLLFFIITIPSCILISIGVYLQSAMSSGRIRQTNIETKSTSIVNSLGPEDIQNSTSFESHDCSSSGDDDNDDDDD